ncbi:hypothetical protein [Terracidiphilus gabretensis]|uniref:hypothetical protein n=1 Tax=Terracidiphilus gabretensis TaxID=1577687 RepID=UPI00071BB161|nr:hypothetical protein [Terracidiphilus gabretensis]
MIQYRDRRVWLLIAVIAIGVVLLLTLIPHAHSGSFLDLLAMLPVLFIGIAFSLDQSSSLIDFCSDLAPETPSFPNTFQRPPPYFA